MALPIKYPSTLQPLAPTFNYTDIEEGTGVTSYYGFTAEKSTGEQYVLTTSQPYSHLVSISGSLGAEIQFSGSFISGILNRPRVIKGTAIFNLTWRVTNSSGSNNNFPFVSLDKYDGSTYTNIGFTSGSIVSSLAGTMYTTALQITSIPATLIKGGEQIRVKFGIEGVDAGMTPRGHIACDPQNRADDWFTTNNFDTTKMIANIPF